MSSIGIIVPPPAKKLVVDRTATFVAQKGRHVEEEILNRPQAQNAASFTFLLEDDPFHAYYLSKIEEFQSGKPLPTKPDLAAVATATAEEEQRKKKEEEKVQPQEQAAPVLSNQLTVAMKLISSGNNIVPPAFEFTLDKPHGMTLRQAKLIQLTARFAVTDGKKFESDLQFNIKRNVVDANEFQFVFPASPLHKYYTDLVRCYRAIATVSNPSLVWINELANDSQVILNRAVSRYEHRRQVELRKQENETEEFKAMHRQQFLEIDWHDFVVVETIWFNDQDQSDGKGGELDQLVSMAAESARRVALKEQDVDGMVVRTDFQVEPVRMTRNTPMVSLADGKRVAVSQMNEHIHAELLDPKWRENQDRFDKRQRETNFVEASSMFTNLTRMFGGEVEDTMEKEEDKRRKEAERIVWDGNMLTADTVKAAVAAAANANHSIASSLGRTSHVPQAPAGSLPPPPAAPQMPMPHHLPEEKRMRMTDSQSDLLRIIVPIQGAPMGLPTNCPTQLSFPTNDQLIAMTVQQLKEHISQHLGNVPVGKFQLKVVSDARFLKNNELISSLDSNTLELEIKWKSR
ncbi:hypothetical protein BASA81_001718 [Batrachochytrium salamandrivorans]|nr:hypothetical protein BASA81_001718 [Batrachochytrium salamandrivorans]